MILLGQPSYDGVADGTAVDRLRMIVPSGLRCEPCPIIATDVVNARARIADIALQESGVSHVLWIDADMRFPADTLCRLLAHGLDIVGANCRGRGEPHLPTAQINGQSVQPATGLQRVDVVGFGIVLTSITALRRTQQTQGDPLFLQEWVGRVNGKPIYRSEDHFFCGKAHAAGFPIYVDHDLSKDCRHITTMELKYEAV